MALVQDIRLVKTNATLLEFLEVVDVLEGLVDIVLESSSELVLLVELLLELHLLVPQTVGAHLEILNDKLQVLVDSVEVLNFLVHLVCFLVQVADLLLSRLNGTLQLFDLVIQHELELLKLLSLLLQVSDTLLFVSNSVLSFGELTLLTLDLCLQVSHLGLQIRKLGVLLLDLLRELILFASLVLVLSGDFREVSLGLETLLNDSGKLFLVLVLDFIDSFPGIIFNVLTSILVLTQHLVDLRLQALAFVVLLLLLKFVLLLHFLHLFLLLKDKLRNALLKLSALFILLSSQLLVPLVVREDLLVEVSLLGSEILFMLTLKLIEVHLALAVNFLLFMAECLIATLEHAFLVLHLTLKLLDSVVVLLERLFDLSLGSGLLLLDVVAKFLDLVLKVIALFAFDQDFIRELDLRKSELLFSAHGLVDDVEAAQNTITAN